MAYSAKNFFSLILLISFLSSFQYSHARDSQFFNKVPSTTTTNNNVVKEDLLSSQEQEPTFLPQNENGYGLYGHESGQFPPSTTTREPATTSKIPYNTEAEKPLNKKYLPKNYNPVAYVTEPEDINDSNSFTEESYTPRNENNNKDFYYNKDENKGSFEELPQGRSNDKFAGGESYSFTPKNRENYNFQPQGMSDTRFVEKGKYFYDLNNERFSRNHPYESLKGVRERNEYSNRNYYGNRENSEEFNNRYSSVEGQFEDEFQEEENLP